MADNVGIVVTYPSLSGDLTVPSLTADVKDVVLTVSLSSYEPPSYTPLFLYVEDCFAVIDLISNNAPGVYFDAANAEDKFSFHLEKIIEDNISVSDVFGVNGTASSLDNVAFNETFAFSFQKSLVDTAAISEVFSPNMVSMNANLFEGPTTLEYLSKQIGKTLSDTTTRTEVLQAGITNYYAADFTQAGYVGSLITL